jgi:LmbE family N-acetylglucosaminyl deacetylase
MDPLVIVSPHLDDAVLSAGQAIAGWPGATILTVASHAPREPMSTDYDQRSGFSSAREACYRRRMEDRAACAVLGASAVHLGMVDGQYGTPLTDDLGPLQGDLLIAKLTSAYFDIQPAVMVCPLGLVHPDHLGVAEWCRHLLADDLIENFGTEVWVYEDQPSRVLYPESVEPALDRWRNAGWKMTLDFLGTAPLDQKEEAVRCYASQLWALDLHAVLCPERLWRLER